LRTAIAALDEEEDKRDNEEQRVREVDDARRPRGLDILSFCSQTVIVRPSSSSALASAPNLYILFSQAPPAHSQRCCIIQQRNFNAKFELPSSSQAATRKALINLDDTRARDPAATRLALINVDQVLWHTNVMQTGTRLVFN